MNIQKPAVIDMQNRKNETYRKALNTALRVLTRRDHSKHELFQKLKARGYAAEIINDVISQCERLDYINDERTAQVLIRQLHRKGYGVKRIAFELTLKGLGCKQGQELVSQSISLSDERQGADKIYQKNIRRFEREKDVSKRKDKIYRFLYGRGFSKTVISELIGKIQNY
jgi:regulatory protein